MKNTQDAQNIIQRLEIEVDLQIEYPDIKIKRQYHKAKKALADARHEFDILNDMKPESE